MYIRQTQHCWVWVNRIVQSDINWYVCSPPNSPNTMSLKGKGKVHTSSPYWSHETNCNDLQLSHHRLGINAGTSSANHKHMMVTAATLQKASNIATAARELTADQWRNIYLYSTLKNSPLNNTLFFLTMTFSTFILVWYCLVITFWVVLSCVSWSYCHSVLTCYLLLECTARHTAGQTMFPKCLIRRSMKKLQVLCLNPPPATILSLFTWMRIYCFWSFAPAEKTMLWFVC